MTQALQSAVHLIFPPACVGCGAHVATDFGLCATCWHEMPFVAGLVCDRCGTPLPGEDDGRPEICDDCMMIARPWSRGRAAFLYKGLARDFILSLKHSDRLDLVRPCGDWLAKAAEPILEQDMIVAPIPLHWSRLLKRRYNQSALLSRSVAWKTGLQHCPDLLQRFRRTNSQEGRNLDQRFANLVDAIRAHPRRASMIAGRHIILVDDVMTSGATFAAATEACLAAGAEQVSVLALARVAKDA